jgi:ADP-ribosyl-[dinitrogen reductase] hydrolase
MLAGNLGAGAIYTRMEGAPVISLLSRYEGCMVGLAAGDALGTTVEFKEPGTFTPLTDIVGGGPFALKKGEWTDDTSMALCLAESLIECGGIDAQDQMERYTRWYRDGYMSSNGRCFDIGITVRQALEKFARTKDPFAGSTDLWAVGRRVLRIIRHSPPPGGATALHRRILSMQ